MAIFEAEHRRKTAAEDQLTSRIFGALAIMDKRDVVFEFLLKLADGQDNQLMKLHNSLIGLSDGDKDKLEVKLWEHFGKRHHWEGYPDVYFEKIPDCLIVLEVKIEKEQVNPEQVVRQYRAVKNEFRNEVEIFYFLLTNDDRLPDKAINEAKAELPDANIFWCRWAQVWRWLKEIRDEKKQQLHGTDKGLLEDLIQLLEDKGMGDFTGIKSEWFTDQIASSVDILNRMFIEFQYLALSLREPKGGEKGIKALKLKELEEKKSFFNLYDVPRGKLEPNKNQRIIPQWIELSYRDEIWENDKEWRDRDKKWRNRKSLRNAYIYVTVEPGKRIDIGFYREGVTDEESDGLRKEAQNERLVFELDNSIKGRKDVYVNRNLIEITNASPVPQVITREEVVNALEKVRDFIRQVYGITDESNAETTDNNAIVTKE